MARHTPTHKKPLKKPSAPRNVGFWQQAWGNFTGWTVRVHFWKKIFIGFILLIFLAVSFMYGIAQWYIYKNRNVPVTYGATFVPDYARYFGLDPKETMTAMVDDLGLRRLRLVSYWENIEPEPGKYNFDELDWQFKMAEEKDVKVSLAIGLRQPRWPECHKPAWAEKLLADSWQQPLYDFMSAVVNRYKTSPALESYQLENEYFLKVFGICSNFDRARLVYEYNMVKGLDPDHPVVVSMSNNAIGTPIGEPTPDQWAISVYKRVWDKTISKRYFEYPIPAWYYAFRAGFTLLTRGHDSFIHELQAEAWTPEGFGGMLGSKLSEQDKSLNSERLKDRIEYGRATGMKTIDLWGVEWWYWRKTVHNDPGLWNTAKTELQRIRDLNSNINN